MSRVNLSVMHTAYRRPHLLLGQIEAVQQQTCKPIAQRIWHNQYEGIKLPSLVHKVAPVIHSSQNLGVWARFLACLEFDTEYVCVLDDDTIPGPRWFENCLTAMEKQEGLYGTVGVIYHTPARRPYWRWGWVRPHAETQEVDLVGHAWFFKRDWLRYFALEPRCGGQTCGEDMHFSVALQKHLGLGTYVPPHPPEDTSLWGSTCGNLGRDQVALYRQDGEEANKARAHRAYLNSGWQLLCQRKPDLVHRLGGLS